jgi:hypothetical protein
MEFPNEVDHASCCLLLPNIIHYEGDGNLMDRGAGGGMDHHSVHSNLNKFNRVV